MVFGDTYHAYVPMQPIYKNMDLMQREGRGLYFVEQHYSLQPAIERLRRRELTDDQFRKICENYNGDTMWGHNEMADSIIAATRGGIRVVAFDTRDVETLGIVDTTFGYGDPAWDNPPKDIPGYPQDLLPAVQRAYDVREQESFDRRSAGIVKEISGDSKAFVWIGNGHIHGGHTAGDEKDFDGHLGQDRTARVSMYRDMQQLREYMTPNDSFGSGVYNLTCRETDQPDFIYIAVGDAPMATTSAVKKRYDTSALIVVDVNAPCYKPDKEGIISVPSKYTKSGTPAGPQ